MNKIWVTRREVRGMLQEFLRGAECKGCGMPIDECMCESANPWAVCTASTGEKSGKKRERCIRKVKKQQGMH